MGRDGEDFDFGEALLRHDSVVSLRLLLRRELRWLDLLFATRESSGSGGPWSLVLVLGGQS